MAYNVDFLVAGLIFLIVITYHVLEKRQWDWRNNRAFIIFLVVGFLNVSLDILCTVFISLSAPELALWTKTTLTLLYMLQILLPYCMVLYVHSMRRTSVARKKRACIMALIPAALCCIVLFTNHWSHLYFTVNEMGQYIRGPLYILVYINGIVYLLAAGATAIIRRQELSRWSVGVVCEYLLFTAVCVAFQVVNHDLLVVGFGITLALAVVMLTVKNPYENTDTLTGLFSREYFHEVAQRLIDNGTGFHLLKLTLPDLRRINLLYGTDAGNKLIIATAKRLLEADTHNQVFRIGENAFLVLATTPQGYQNACDAVVRYSESAVFADSSKVGTPPVLCGFPGVSDLATCDEILTFLEYLAGFAVGDELLCRIESTQEHIARFRYHQKITAYVDTAIANDLFEVVYQPIYSLKEQRYVSIEALTRLKHPEYGYISPELIFQLAERNGQILELSLMQFRRICRFVKAHESIMRQLRSVKFNLSVLELQNPGHIEDLTGVIREYGLSGSYFQFEVTETMATNYHNAVGTTADILQREGIGLCMDDFGSGFANLNSVLQLPFQTIKLDRSLISRICRDEKSAAFYQKTAALFLSLGYQVVAEGIEEQQELELIAQSGIHLVQGYYFSRPLSPDDLLAALSSRHMIEQQQCNTGNMG